MLGQMNAATLFNLVMITLVVLGAVFWVGAQLWLNFVLLMSAEKHSEEQTLNTLTQARFERRFSFFTLLVILLANTGVLIGEGLNLTGGNWASALRATSLFGLATSRSFGVFWLIGEGVVIVALAIALFTRSTQQRARWVHALLPLLNLLLGLILFLAITMTRYTASVGSSAGTLTIVLGWLQLLAAALWIGGLLYIVVVYLPVLKERSFADRTRSLATALPYFTPLAIIGVILTFVSVIFSATLDQVALNQAAYGRTFVVAIALLAGLLICSAIQLFLFSPAVGKEYRKYAYMTSRIAGEASHAAVGIEARQNAPLPQQAATTEPVVTIDQAPKRLARQMRLREKRLGSKTRRLTTIARWEAVLSIAALFCLGLMSIFAGTLTPVGATTQQQTGAKPLPFTATVHTADSKFNVQLEINPNRFGTNIFTVTVTDNSTGKVDTNVGITIFTTMLDMDMGTDSLSLLPDHNGHFSASGELSMAGHWQIRIQIRTSDGGLHEASTNIVTPF